MFKCFVRSLDAHTAHTYLLHTNGFVHNIYAWFNLVNDYHEWWLLAESKPQIYIYIYYNGINMKYSGKITIHFASLTLNVSAFVDVWKNWEIKRMKAIRKRKRFSQHWMRQVEERTRGIRELWMRMKYVYPVCNVQCHTVTAQFKIAFQLVCHFRCCCFHNSQFQYFDASEEKKAVWIMIYEAEQ